MEKNVKESVKNLVQNVISLTNLPILPGLRGDYDLGWSGTRTKGMEENFFAQVHIRGNELVLGFLIEVGAYGYDLTNRRDGFSELYWSRTITSNELENNRELLMKEIRDAITKAWNDLPQLYQKMLQNKIVQERLLEQLRREGKFVE